MKDDFIKKYLTGALAGAINAYTILDSNDLDGKISQLVDGTHNSKIMLDKGQDSTDYSMYTSSLLEELHMLKLSNFLKIGSPESPARHYPRTVNHKNPFADIM